MRKVSFPPTRSPAFSPSYGVGGRGGQAESEFFTDFFNSFFQGGGDTANFVDVILYLGNSAASGRDDRVAEVFETDVLEFTQAGTLVHAGDTYGNGANLDGDDSNDDPDYYCPAVSYSAQYLIDNPTLAKVIIVPQYQGSSDLDGSWAITGGVATGADASAAETRLAAAYVAIAAAGYVVRRTITSYMSLASDLNTSANGDIIPDLSDQIDAFADFFLNISEGDASFVMNTGQGTTWLAANFDADYAVQQQFRRTLNYSKDNCAAVDFEAFEYIPIDGTGHQPTSANIAEVGPRLAAAAITAQTRAETEFKGLSFFDDFERSYPAQIPLYNEVTGIRDLIVDGAPRCPIWADAITPMKTFIGIQNSSSRVLTCPTPVSSTWTLLWSGTIDAFASTFGVFQNTAVDIRLYHSNGNGWRFGTSGTSGTRTVNSSGGDFISLALTFDGSNLQLFENGIANGAIAAMGGATSAGQLLIGAQSLSGTTVNGFLTGKTFHAGIVDGVLTPTEIAEYHTVASESNFLIQTPDEISDLLAWHNPRIDMTIVRDPSDLIEREQDIAGTLDAAQTDQTHKPTYNDVDDYVQYGGLAGNQEYLEMGAVAFGSDDFSISVWGYSDDLSSFIQRWFSLKDGTTSSAVSIYTHNSTPSIRATVTDASGNSVTATIDTAVINTWFHIVITVDRASDLLKYYVDGSLAGSTSIAALTDVINSNAGSFANLLGKENKADAANARSFQGRLGDDHIYTKVLTASDVLNIYNDRALTPIPVLTTDSGDILTTDSGDILIGE